MRKLLILIAAIVVIIGTPTVASANPTSLKTASVVNDEETEKQQGAFNESCAQIRRDIIASGEKRMPVLYFNYGKNGYIFSAKKDSAGYYNVSYYVGGIFPSTPEKVFLVKARVGYANKKHFVFDKQTYTEVPPNKVPKTVKRPE